MPTYTELQDQRNSLLKKIRAMETKVEVTYEQTSEILHVIKSLILLRKELVKVQHQLIECLLEKAMRSGVPTGPCNSCINKPYFH